MIFCINEWINSVLLRTVSQHSATLMDLEGVHAPRQGPDSFVSTYNIFEM